MITEVYRVFVIISQWANEWASKFNPGQLVELFQRTSFVDVS